MLEIELYQIFLSLGRGRSGYEIKLKCDVTFILISRAAILLASSTGERDRGSVDEKCILLENTYSCILHISVIRTYNALLIAPCREGNARHSWILDSTLWIPDSLRVEF